MNNKKQTIFKTTQIKINKKITEPNNKFHYQQSN
jgi:hypothetical protein